MMAFTPFTGAVFVAHMVAGVVLGYSLLKTMEYRISVAGLYAVLFTGTVVAVDRWVGKVFLEFGSWSEFEVTVIAAVLGAVVGISFVILGWKPELEDSVSERMGSGLGLEDWEGVEESLNKEFDNSGSKEEDV